MIYMRHENQATLFARCQTATIFNGTVSAWPRWATVYIMLNLLVYLTNSLHYIFSYRPYVSVACFSVFHSLDTFVDNKHIGAYY